MGAGTRIRAGINTGGRRAWSNPEEDLGIYEGALMKDLLDRLIHKKNTKRKNAVDEIKKADQCIV